MHLTKNIIGNIMNTAIGGTSNNGKSYQSDFVYSSSSYESNETEEVSLSESLLMNNSISYLTNHIDNEELSSLLPNLTNSEINQLLLHILSTLDNVSSTAITDASPSMESSCTMTLVHSYKVSFRSNIHIITIYTIIAFPIY